MKERIEAIAMSRRNGVNGFIAQLIKIIGQMIMFRAIDLIGRQENLFLAFA